MGTESTGSDVEAPGAAATADTAVPIRRAIGPSPGSGRRAAVATNVVAVAGWVLAGAVVLGGGFTLWHLLFGGSVGGDVWLGQPSAWIDDQSGDDSRPGGEPWTPDVSGRPASTVTSVAITIDTLLPSTLRPSTTPAPQAPPGQGSAATPATGTVPGDASQVTVTTAVPPGGTVPSSTSSSSSTTIPSTTDEAATTTIDDSSSTTIDDGDGNSGRSGGDD